LIHGGAGAVGLYAVQLAHIFGARVITTVSGRDIDLVKRLGADEAIDYEASCFEIEVKAVDVVFDAVAGETLVRSWGVLKPDGRMITIAAGSEGATDQRVKDAFFIVEPNQKQLVEIAKQLDAGRLRAFVKTTVPLNEAPAAYSGRVTYKNGYGKIVIAVSTNGNPIIAPESRANRNLRGCGQFDETRPIVRSGLQPIRGLINPSTLDVVNDPQIPDVVTVE
jgi:NADPH:quinone reductase-like Zn-dependent oxidoreductase